MADQFRTIMGVVEFPPKDGEANGKAVRNITVRQTGFKDQNVKVSATVWPSHEHVEINEGDVVVLKGKYSQNQSTNKEGAPITYHNLSVTGLTVLGQIDPGERVERVNTGDDASDDDIPF